MKPSQYDELPDDELVTLAVEFLAREVPMPEAVKARLKRMGIYEQLTNP